MPQEQLRAWEIETTPEQDKAYRDSLPSWDMHAWCSSYFAARDIVWWIKNSVYPTIKNIHIIDVVYLIQHGPDPLWVVEYSYPAMRDSVRKYIVVQGNRNDWFHFSFAQETKMKYPPLGAPFDKDEEDEI